MTDYERIVVQARTLFTYVWDNPDLYVVWPVNNRIQYCNGRLVRLSRDLPDGRMIGYDEYKNFLVISLHPVPEVKKKKKG